MIISRFSFFLLLFLIQTFLLSQTNDFNADSAYSYIKHLSLTIGPRPMGSQNERTALEWATEKFKGYGADSVYVLDSQESRVREVTRTCPECKNDKAYQWFSSVSGEHAGVGRERTVEHYRCTRCAHSWSESR